MTIAILPTLVEFFATGSVAVVAGMAGWYLFKHNKAPTKSPNQNNNPPQAASNTSPAVNQDVPEPTPAPVVETVKKETAPITETAVEPSPSAVEISTATVSEETILKRHHLHNIRLMLEATTFPRPTDSVLSRHYDEMIDAKAEDCLADEAKMARLTADYQAYENAASTAKPAPSDESSAESFAEEQMLKRHHLHNIRVMVVATTFPRPTDSTLSRHYDEMIDAKAEDCLENEAKMARLIADYEAYQSSLLVTKTAPVAPAQAASQASVAVQHKQAAIPEDATLRRHYLSALRAKIEQSKAPRPTDSTLRRHYDAMIAAEVENYLAGH